MASVFRFKYRCVAKKALIPVMPIPNSKTLPKTTESSEECCIIFNSGNRLLISKSKMVSPLNAISELITPRRKCIHINGLRIKDFVAPTNCIVLIMNLLE